MLKIAALVVGSVAIFWGGKLLLRIAFNVAVAHSPNTRKREVERDTLEEADWFGKTGLGEETERELPRYLRREFGEYLDDPACLKAADMVYLGIRTDARGSAHFWSLPERHGERSFAYAQLAPSGEVLCLGWGDWAPPSE
jgi:hypothetical protein